MDMSQLSTADLEALAAGDMARVSTQGLRYLSGGDTPAGPGGFVAATKAGFSNLKGDLARAAGRTGLMGLAEADAYAKEQEDTAKQQFTPGSKGWTETPWEEFKELAGGSAAYMAAPVAAGAAATFAGAPALAVAGAAGLASAAQFTGSNISRQMDTGKKLEETDLGNAVMAAAPQAALDIIGLGKIPGVRQLIGMVSKDIGAEAAQKIAGQSIKQIAADYAKATGKAMGYEGITEAGQQVLERMQAGLDIADPQARQEYWHSFVGGAVLGGALSPAGRYVERGQIEGKQAQAAVEERKKAAAAKAALPPDASKDTPEYATQFAQEHEALKAERMALQKTLAENVAKKSQPDYHERAAANKAAGTRLGEVNALLQERNAEFQRIQPFMPPAEEAATPNAPGTDLFGEAVQPPAADVEAEADVAPPADMGEDMFRNTGALNEKVQGLAAALEEHQNAADAATTPQEIAGAARQVQRTQADYDIALAEQQALVKQQAKDNAPDPLIGQYQRATKAMIAAKEAGDWKEAARLADKVMALNKDGAADQAVKAREDAKQAALDAKAAEKQAKIDAAAKEVARVRPAAMPTDTAEQGNLFAGTDIDAANVRTLPNVPKEELASRVVRGANKSPMTGTSLSVRPQIQQAMEALRAARLRRDNKGVQTAIDRIRDLKEMAKPVEGFGDQTSDLLDAIPDEMRQPINVDGEQSPALAGSMPQNRDREQAAAARRADVMSQYGGNRQGQVAHAAVTALTNEMAAITGRPLNAREKRAVAVGVRDVFRANQPTKNNLFNIGERVNEQLTALRGDLLNAQRRAVPKVASEKESENTTRTTGTPVQAQIDTLRNASTTTPETHARLDQLEDSMSRFPEAEQAAPRAKTKKERDAQVKTARANTVGRNEPDVPTQQDVARYLTQGAREEDWAPIGDYLAQQERMGRSDTTDDWVTTESAKAAAESGTAPKQQTAYQPNLPATRDTELQGTVFDTREEFEAYLQGDALHALRTIEKEKAVAQTLSRAQARIAPLQAAAADMKQTLGQLQRMYEASKNVTTRNVTNAENAMVAAQARMDEIQGKLEAELSAFRESIARIDAAWKFESDTANDISRRIEANMYAYAGPEAALLRRVWGSRAAVDKALAKDVNKVNWTALRNLQKQVVADAEAWARTTRDASPALLAYMRRDTRLQSELSEQIELMVELHNRRDDVEAGLREAQQAQKRRVLFKREFPAAQSARDTARNEKAQAEGIGGRAAAKNRDEAALIEENLQKTQDEIDAEMRPVLEAQRRRGFIDPAAQARTAAAEKDAESRKMQKAREALDALPGTRITHEAYRNALDKLGEADVRLKELQANIDRFQAEYDAKLQLPDAKANSKTSLNKAKRALESYRELMLAASKLLSTVPEARSAAYEQLADLQANAKEEVERQRARVAEEDTPSRREALKRAVTEATRVTKLVNAISESSAERTPVMSGAAREAERKAFDEYERAQMAAKLEEEGTTGKLKPAIKGVLARKATNPGTMRTGDASTAAERAVSSRNPPQQTGQRRGVTASQAVREGNEVSEAKRAGTTVAPEDAVSAEDAAKAWKQRQRREIRRVEDALEEGEQRYDAVQEQLTEAMDNEDIAGFDQYTEELAAIDEELNGYKTELAAMQPKVRGESTPRAMGDGTGIQASVETRQALHDGDVLGTLDELIAETTSPEEIAILEALRPHIEGVKIGVRDELKLDGKEIAGVYHEGSNQVEMHPDRLTREDITHELAHAATATVLNTPDSQLAPHQVAAKKGLLSMLEQMRSNPAFKDEYAITDVKEFASEVFSNPQLRDKMDVIGKPQTLMQRFASFVARLFGGGKPPSDRAVKLVKDILSPARMQGNSVSTPSVFRNKPRSYGDAEGSVLAAVTDRMIAQPVPFLERLGGNIALNFERLVVDMRAAHRAALKKGADATADSGRLTEQAAYDIIKSDQIMPMVQATMLEGSMESYVDANGLHGWKSSGKNGMGDVFTPLQRLGGDSTAEVAMLTQYLVAKRVENKGIDKAGYGDMKLDPKELKAIVDEVNANPERKSAYDEARTAYNAYNEGLVNMMASTGAIPKSLAKELLKDSDYVAMYRVDKLGMASLLMGSHTISLGDVKHQPYLDSLKGGDTKILPLNETIPRNTTLLVSMALTNRAAKSAAYAYQDLGAGTIQKGQGAPDRAVLHFRQEPAAGETGADAGKRWIRLDTEGTVLDGIPAEMIIKSLEGTNLVLPGFLKVAGVAANLLRSGITRMPMYVARQLVRDPMIASGTTGLGGDPFSAVFKAGNEFLKQAAGKSDTARELVLKGLVQSQIYTGDASHDLPKFAQELASGTNPNAINKLFNFMDRMAVRADTSTRALIYEAALKRGLSEVQAEIHTMESMNFHKRGASAGIQYMHHMIPFFSSQIQGLSIIAKAARGNMPHNEQLQIRRKFYNNAAILFGTGLMYAAAMQDDDYYKNAKPRDRMANWYVPLPGVDEPVKIPIPFEYGFFFSAAVAAVDGMMGIADGEQQRKAIKELLLNAVPGMSNLGMPQIVKPAAEVFFNKNVFSDSPLESVGQQRKVTEERFNANTTELAKLISRAAPMLSPIQIEHMVKGYLGQAPILIAAMTNQMLLENSDVQRPAGGATDTPFFGQALQRKFGGGAADAAYDIANRAMEVKASMDDIAKSGRRERLIDFRKEHAAELRQMGLGGAFIQQMGEFSKAKKAARDSNLLPEPKKARIDKIDNAANEYAKKVLAKLQAIENAY